MRRSIVRQVVRMNEIVATFLLKFMVRIAEQQLPSGKDDVQHFNLKNQVTDITLIELWPIFVHGVNSRKQQILGENVGGNKYICAILFAIACKESTA